MPAVTEIFDVKNNAGRDLRILKSFSASIVLLHTAYDVYRSCQQYVRFSLNGNAIDVNFIRSQLSPVSLRFLNDYCWEIASTDLLN